MKTFLFVAVSSVIIAAALPSLLAKIILSAVAILAALLEMARPRPRSRPRNRKII